MIKINLLESVTDRPAGVLEFFDEVRGVVSGTGIDDEDFLALIKAADAICEIGLFVLANDERRHGEAIRCGPSARCERRFGEVTRRHCQRVCANERLSRR